MSAGARRPKRPASADISVTAEIRAERLRFGEVPETHTEFTGAPAYQSASGTDRANLPDRVQKNVTYRHVRVNYWLAANVIYPSQADRDGGPPPGIEASALQRPLA